MSKDDSSHDDQTEELFKEVLPTPPPDYTGSGILRIPNTSLPIAFSVASSQQSAWFPKEAVNTEYGIVNSKEPEFTSFFTGEAASLRIRLLLSSEYPNRQVKTG